MIFKKKDKESKPKKEKKVPVMKVGTHKKTVIALWLVLITSVSFGVYKNFTAIDMHTVHEKEVIEQRIVDTNRIENFVKAFAKSYYSWSNTQESIDKRTAAINNYLTKSLQDLNVDTVRQDIPTSSTVTDVKIWDIEQAGTDDFTVVYSVDQTVTEGETSIGYTSAYMVVVHVDSKEWEFYKVFADEGISGTSTKKREQFNQMIAEARQGKFDLLLTKEISRFARNTLDSIYYTRELRKVGVGVLFLNDGINTLEGDAELRLSIMASIAQEESRKTSERVKWGQKRRMEEGVVFGRSMLGYDVKNGKMYVNEEGAEVVRKIFYKFVLERKSTHTIAKELLEEGIYPMRSEKWRNTVILRILQNEKYCGDLVQKKTFTPDYLSHEKKYNRGEEEFVIIKNHHVPIISREMFEKAEKIFEEKQKKR